MEENNIVHIGENSPEAIAFKLLHDIAYAEGKTDVNGRIDADREYILSTFKEALSAMKPAVSRMR